MGLGESGSRNSGRGDAGGELFAALELCVLLRLLGVLFLLDMTMLGNSKDSVSSTFVLDFCDVLLLRLEFFLLGILECGEVQAVLHYCRSIFAEIGIAGCLIRVNRT